jgi:hypothetical protein
MVGCAQREVRGEVAAAAEAGLSDDLVEVVEQRQEPTARAVAGRIHHGTEVVEVLGGAASEHFGEQTVFAPECSSSEPRATSASFSSASTPMLAP